MKETIKRLEEDFEAYYTFPDEAIDKIKCELRHGKRIYWYCKVDVEYLEEDENPRDHAPYSGLVIAKDGVNVPQRDAELEIDDIVVVLDTYPVEKCYCESTWIGFPALLNDPELVEIFDIWRLDES